MEPVTAVVWHFWIGFSLAALAVFAVIVLVALYFNKVVATRYPPD